MSWPALGRGTQHHAITGGHQADAAIAQLYLEIAEPGVELLSAEAGDGYAARRD